MNRHTSAKLGFVPFDEETLTATPALIQHLLNSGFTQEQIDAANKPGA